MENDSNREQGWAGMLLRHLTMRCVLLLLLWAIWVGGVSASSTDLTEIVSRFESSDEDWTIVELPDTFGAGPYGGIAKGPFKPRFLSRAGNPPGALYQLDTPGNSFYFAAPPKFLGNVRESFGMLLQFDLRAPAPPPGDWFIESDIILIGTNGLVLVTSFYREPMATYTTYEVPLVPLFWAKRSLFGDPPSPEEFLTVLGNLKSLWIRGEHYNGNDAIYFDNVRLELSGGLPRRAIARPIVTNGFLVGVELLDSGYGFTAPPVIQFMDPTGGGSGAIGMSRIVDGWLTEVVMSNAGTAYSADTEVLIEPATTASKAVPDHGGRSPPHLSRGVGWLPISAWIVH